MDEKLIRKPYSKYNTGYDKELDNYERLRESESIELLKKLRNGDLSARDKLITGNIYLVFSSAIPYKNKGLELIDLISIGTIGLIKAIDKYDINKDTSFNNYAHQAITNSVLNGLYNEARHVRIPTYQIDNYHEYTKRESDNITIDELKVLFGLDEDSCNNLYYTLKEPVFYGVSADIIDELNTNMDLSCSAEDEFLSKNIKEDIKKAIEESNLSDKEIKLLNLRFGFNGNNSHSLAELAELYKLSYEGVRLRVLGVLSKIAWSKNIESYCGNNKEKNNLQKLRRKEYQAKKNNYRKTKVK